MSVRLIASDLDGTLLDPSGRIAEADADALREASQAGVTIVIATGRPLRWLTPLEAIADVRPLVIVSNGAAVWDLRRRRIEQAAPLERTLVACLADELRSAVPELVFALEEGTGFACEDAWLGHPPDTSRTRAQEEAVTDRGPLPRLLAQERTVLKFLASHPDADADALLERARAVIGGRAVVTHSVVGGRRALLEISAAGVTKAVTLARLCADRGIEASEVAAFGDMPNDTEMLDYAGRPFAMANAHPSLRARFPVIGGNHEAGVGAQVRALLARGQ
ncbi:MAG: HAD hydrolase family protein [Propioniciclava sp.]|uniref:HAD hydrolase family protein n=1 Tax=Propioniciclava sp. TaxID=2038686 RepID=UPI0039E5FAC9